MNPSDDYGIRAIWEELENSNFEAVLTLVRAAGIFDDDDAFPPWRDHVVEIPSSISTMLSREQESPLLDEGMGTVEGRTRSGVSREQERPLLDEGRTDRLRREVEEIGIEALAWYTPYHFDPHRWGIYLRETGILYLAEYLRQSGIATDQAISVATSFLHWHESAHAFVEVVVAIRELIFSRYSYYMDKDLRTRLQSALGQWEEALANAVAIRHSDAQSRKALEAFTRHQPPGYRDWSRFAGKSYPYQVNDFFNAWCISGKLPRGHWYPSFTWASRRVRDIPVYVVQELAWGHGLAFCTKYHGLRLAVRFAEHFPPHFEVEFSGDRKKRRYQYPFERDGRPPFDPAPPTTEPLTRREERLVCQAIERFGRQRFLDELRKQIVHLKKTFPDDQRGLLFNDQGFYVGPLAT